jgi:hypothetical protein
MWLLLSWAKPVKQLEGLNCIYLGMPLRWFIMLFLTKLCLKDWYSGEIPHIVIAFSNYKKRINRIIMGSRITDTWRELFKILKIVLLSSQYLFSLVIFVVNNKGLFIKILYHRISKLVITPIFINHHHT